jgi:hypothetical protein
LTVLFFEDLGLVESSRGRFERVSLLERLASLSVKVDSGGGELASGNSVVEENREFGVSSSLGLGKTEEAPGDTEDVGSGEEEGCRRR